MTPKIQPDQTTAYRCVACQNSYLFDQRAIIRKIPGLLIGSPTDAIQPMEVLACVKCHAIVPDSIPNMVGILMAEGVLPPVEKKPTVLMG